MTSEETILVEPWAIRLAKRLLMLHIIAGVVMAGHYMPLLYRARPDDTGLFLTSLAWEVGMTIAKIAIWQFLFRKRNSATRWIFTGLLAFIWLNIAAGDIYWHVNMVMMTGILTAILPLLFLPKSSVWFQTKVIIDE